MTVKTQPADLFAYEFRNGDVIRILKFGLVPAEVMRRTRKLPPSDLIFTVLEEVADEDALAVFDRQGQVEAAEFVAAWQEDAKVTVGKS